MAKPGDKNMDFNALGLSILRISFGATMAIQYGLPKLLNFSDKMHTFPDPLGLGSPLSLALAIGAEFFCASAVVLGIFTRLATLPLIMTMGVAFFIFHIHDPFAKKQLSMLYMLAFSAIFACGPGAYSADVLFRRVK